MLKKKYISNTYFNSLNVFWISNTVVVLFSGSGSKIYLDGWELANLRE